MNFDVVIDDMRHFMRVTVSGEPSLEELLSMIHLLGVESESWQENKVLVDLRAVATHFSRPEQFRIGEEASLSLSHMDRIASLVPADRVTRVSEKAARRNGVNVRVFDDEGLAIAWLQAPLGGSRIRPGSGSRG